MPWGVHAPSPMAPCVGCSGRCGRRANGTLTESVRQVAGAARDALARWPDLRLSPASAGLWGHVVGPSDPVCG